MIKKIIQQGISVGRDISLTLKRVRERSPVPVRELSLKEIFQYGFPHSNMPDHIRQWKRANLPYFWRGLTRETAAKVVGVNHFSGHVCLAIISPEGVREDYGLVSMRVITTSGLAQVINAFRGLFTLSNFRYHALGSGTAAEASTDTTLAAEHSLLYNTPNTRPTGTLQQGTSSTIFRSVATVTLSDTASISEYGLLSQASTNSGSPTGGYLFDRALITPQTIIVGFSTESDYRLTAVAGS